MVETAAKQDLAGEKNWKAKAGIEPVITGTMGTVALMIGQA